MFRQKTTMGPKPSIYSLDAEARREIEQYAAKPGWQRIKGDNAPSFLPPILRSRTKEIVVVTVPASSSATVIMFNLHRVDAPARQIDHQPFVVVVQTSGASTVGHFIDHGDWEKRSTPLVIPENFTGPINSSGIASYYRANPSTDSTGGGLDTLPMGDRAAFERATGIVGIDPVVHRSV
jgi:hypothetical protein